jgi:hypothetical protein
MYYPVPSQNLQFNVGKVNISRKERNGCIERYGIPGGKFRFTGPKAP